MYIDKRENDFFRADIYLVDDPADAVMADRIRVLPDGKVIWNRDNWTPEEVLQFIARLSAAFAVAFKIAKE